MNVVLNQADAGGGVLNSLNKQSQSVREKLRVLYTTQGMASHPIVAHPSVPEDIVKRVRNSFLDFSKTLQGEKLLKKIPMRQIGETTMRDYEPLLELGLDKFYVRNE